MNRLKLLSMLSALTIAGAAHAQTTSPQQTSPSETQQTQTDAAQSGQSSSETQGTTQTPTPSTADPGTANPVPSTSPTEGTAADRTPPGETPVQGTAASQAPAAATRMAAGSAGMTAGDQHRASKLMGLAVRDRQGKTIGEVRDFIVDSAKGELTHAIIAHGGTAETAQEFTAVPWTALSPMLEQDGVVIDESRLAAAPSFRQGELDTSGSSAGQDIYWRNVDRYWGSGSSSRSATSETGTSSGSSSASGENRDRG